MNNKYGLTRENLLSTLPDVLKSDKGMLVLGTLLAEMLANLAETPGKTKIYADIASLNEDVLDTLAKDFKIDWYDFNYVPVTKRILVEDSFYIHGHLGTKGSVVQALSDVYPDSMVREWFEYGGMPYYFMIIIDATTGNELINLGAIKDVIIYYKPIRAHLQDDNVVVRVSCGIAINTSQAGQSYNTPLCGTFPAVSTQGSIEDGGFMAAASAAGGLYHVPRCGAAQNVLM